ncbi:hypothetical protein [Nocardia sp. NPDC003963]
MGHSGVGCPSPVRRVALIGSALIVATLIGGCGIFGRAENDPPVARDPDVLVSIDESPGFLNPERAGSRRLPFFELRRDGTVFTTVREGAEESEFGVYRAQLTTEGVEQVRAWFSDLAFDDARYPDNSTTDQPTTSVYANFDGPVGVSVYGLDTESGPRSGDADLRMLEDVIDRLRELPDDEELTVLRREPYTPATLDIAFQPAVPEGGEGLSAPARWPLATPLTRRDLGVGGYGAVLCATLDGAEAATIAELVAGDERYRQPHWSTGAAARSGQPTSVFVTVNAVLPGRAGCRAVKPDPAALNHVVVEPLQEVAIADPAVWDGRYPADRFTIADRLELYAAVPILVRELEAVSDAEDTRREDERPVLRVPTGSDLTWYDYRFVAAEVGGARCIDLEARYAGVEPDRWEPPIWRARVDLTAEVVTELDLD